MKEAQCGILVEPGQPEALAEAIQWLLEHPAEAQAMGNRGRQAILQTYNWNSQAQLLLHLYRRVTFRSGSSPAAFSLPQGEVPRVQRE